MSKDDSFEKASLNAQKTMALLQDRKIKSIPQNFTIWYEYLSGDNPAIIKLVNRLLSEHGKFSESVSKQIYNEFFSHDRESKEIRETNLLVQQSMEAVLRELRNSSKGLTNYGEKLENFAGKADGLSVADLQNTVRDIIQETQTMASQSQHLNENLKKASDEIEDLKKRLELVENESLTDPLTQIANRKKFDIELMNAISSAQAENNKLCLVMSDIDHFKKFNDTHGHLFGDQVLKLVARILENNMRGGALAARYGGEEFGLILPKTSLSAAFQLSDKIRKTVSSKSLVNRNTGDEVGKITMSFGIAQYTPGENVDAFIERADAVLYSAKENGRDQVRMETQEMAAAV
ncbi:diguanylate cyclase [Sneathiella limimaris]|uniref:diguanylate cyclase n=1 Tax=Sneathiella limimaris TaxID=1964213 RepID=UPI00146D554D